QKVAAEVAERYGDGAWFVDFAPISDPRHVASAVAQVLKVRDTSRGSLDDALCADLKGMQLLLVLDNCEHLAEACAHLVEKLLGSVGEITILATSREPLAIPGEQVMVLPPLRLPDSDASREAVEETDAVRLFLDRARRQLPDFTLEGDRARLVAQLCLRLDGIPLALELAAARVR